MHPADIKALIEKAGTNQARIASQLGVTRGAVSAVISGGAKSGRIALAISEAIGVPLIELWPKVYPKSEFVQAFRRTNPVAFAEALASCGDQTLIRASASH